jgi:hypothetical protein
MVLALLIHLRESCTVQTPTSKEEKAITAAAKLDPDAQPLTANQLKAMVPDTRATSKPNSVLRVTRFQANSGNVEAQISICKISQ